MERTHGQGSGHGDDCFGCKVLSVQLLPPAFQAHFNYATGQYVRNEAEFRDALKRGSEAASMRVGMDHDFQPLMPGDIPQPTRDDYIFETRAKAIRDGVVPLDTSDPSPTIDLDAMGRSVDAISE